MKDDVISRQAAIDAIHEDADWLAAQGSDWQVERMERDKSILKSLPTVQPKPGRWNKIHWKAFKCSECNRVSEYHTNFCPNCGADMRGEQESE